MKVLITGGSRGIGAACVRAFCQMGDSVAFLYHTNHERAKVLSNETGAIAICTDVADAASVTAATQEAIARLGGIDVLVNNAGISQIKLFSDITDEDWRKMIDTNLAEHFTLAVRHPNLWYPGTRVKLSISDLCGARWEHPARCTIRHPRRD